MTINEIRKKYLEFFASKDHRIVTSDSLVPKDDPTVLFTTAGMQQFKQQFLGNVGDYTRAATSQKCLRTDDLDKVGKTDCHHTFFEMLGNFSFGDYFKKEAIGWAWEFLTKELNIPAQKLWVSVYKDDDEAENIWLKEIHLDPQRVVRLGDHSNFWPADAKEKGPNGPCGPCSEIFFDYGVNPKCKSAQCDPSCDCGRFSEIWNLVFTQFDRKEGGVLEALPNKNIDTGMGLERLAAVVQGKKNNFETDLFEPILKSIDEHVSKQLTPTQRYIIADHIRAIVFAINDGVVPSNKEKGYVVKVLINNSANIALSAGLKDPSIYKLVSSVVEVMKVQYPELQRKEKEIVELIKQSEQTFLEVMRKRIPELRTEIRQYCKLLIAGHGYDQKVTVKDLGDLFFIYHDTYGLPLETILITVNEEIGDRYKREMEDALGIYRVKMMEQQKRSRAASKMTGDVFSAAELELDVTKTEFCGYEHFQSVSTILRLFVGNQKVNEVSKGDQVKVVLDKTSFYAEAGGQIGDTGYIVSGQGKIRVEGTQKINDVYIHTGLVEEGLLRVEERVDAQVNKDRRLAVTRHHTATHLLQLALREVLGKHVQQQGSLVAEERLRFDFTHPKAISSEELERIEARVNECVLRCDLVVKEELSIQKAKESGALAFFAEKYGDKVRVVSIGNYSKEFCGGTHLDYTGQVGLFKIVNECAIAQGIRRLEAKTGVEALRYVKIEETQLKEAAKILKSSDTDFVDRLNKQTQRLKQLEKELEKYRLDSIRNSIDNVIESAENLNGTKIVIYMIPDAEMEFLRRVGDLIKQKIKSAVILLGAKTSEVASCVLLVTPDLVTKGIKANELIKEIAFLMEGSGGGQLQMAQAGSKHPDRMEAVMHKAVGLLKGKLNS